MKKALVIIAIVAAAATSASAQNLSVTAGYLNSIQQTSVNSVISTNNAVRVNGFYAGIGAEKAFNSYFGLATGLCYSFLTSSSSVSASTIATASSKTNEHYFTLPVHFTVGVPVVKDVRVFLEAGPAANIGLASSTTGSASVLGINASTSGDNYGENGNYTRFDLLLGGIAGVQIKNIRIFGGYNRGLMDRNKSDNAKLYRSEIVAGVAFCL